MPFRRIEINKSDLFACKLYGYSLFCALAYFVYPHSYSSDWGATAFRDEQVFYVSVQCRNRGVLREMELSKIFVGNRIFVAIRNANNLSAIQEFWNWNVQMLSVNYLSFACRDSGNSLPCTSASAMQRRHVITIKLNRT